MENTVVSIIVPIYNVESYLETCVDSLINQTYQNVEIILVDDGSSDNSGMICDRFAEADDRIIVIHQKNVGVSQARNTGIDTASGKYLMFVDGDDWIDRETCQEAVTIAEETGVDIVFWSYVREYMSRGLRRQVCSELHEKSLMNCKDIRRRLVGLRGDELQNPENLDVLSPVWGKLYKRHCIVKSGIRFVDLAMIGTQEDALFNIQLFKHLDKATYINKCFYHYRKSDSSTTTIYREHLWIQWNRLYDLIISDIRDEHTEELCTAIQNRIALNLIGLGLNSINSGRSIIRERKEILQIIESKRYSHAVMQLEIKTMPLHWRLFFICAKKRFAYGVLFLCYAIKTLKRIV